MIRVEIITQKSLSIIERLKQVFTLKNNDIKTILTTINMYIELETSVKPNTHIQA